MDTRQRFDGHGYRQQSANWQAAVDRRLTTLNASWVRCAFIVHHLLCSPPLGNRVTRYTPSRPSVRHACQLLTRKRNNVQRSNFHARLRRSNWHNNFQLSVLKVIFTQFLLNDTRIIFV